ncbi:cell wall-associated NlpC family hydrolase [Streptomyces umbrinus]|uniref:Cell wall-associated NlpC family hydrolase n=1 Tax=Streptomyces umbrinus TaxID=67370 RepID=A0ABU0SRL5_9ACTN|nr:C40 family peptidase [Streptomyces umbrinus]MDQ1026153.1 cell wall-associated NlpC family hydrolase [Streptomyces umbrinus]
MSGRLLRLVCTAAIAAGAVLAPGPAAAVPEPGESPVAEPGESLAPDSVPEGEPSVAELLTDLQRLYREAEEATETYNATEEKLKRQRTEVARLNGRLSAARLSLQGSRGAAGRLARQQYQGTSEISSYVRLLLARDPQHALDQGQVIRQVSLERAGTVDRLAVDERRSDRLAREARRALDEQLTLAERQKKDRDLVGKRLKDVEELLVSLSAEQLARVAELEKSGVAEAQDELVTSGALSSARPPSREGDEALRHAVDQIGKPYEWGAEGPDTYDCSGLTSEAWGSAGRAIPRTSQEQWAQLPRVELNELRPGDLVVYFPEATHVAMYLGDGMVVQAPRPGATVKVSPIAANPVLGAVRPDPDGEPLQTYTPPELPEGATDGSDEGYSTTSHPGALGTAQSATTDPHPR